MAAWGLVIRKYWHLLWLLCGLVSAAHAAPIVPSETLVVGVLSEPRNLHPIRDWTFAKSFLFGFINRPLIARDESGMTNCFLCVAMPTEANGNLKVVDLPDHRRGMEASFAIRPEARWADGVPITSRDMSFTIEVAHAVGVQNADGNVYRHVTGVTELDDHRFVLHFDEVNYAFLTDNKLFLISEHIEAARFRAAANPEEYLAHSAYREHPEQDGLWNGPYRIAAQGEHEIVLEGNPHWGGRAPQFKKIVLREIPEMAALMEAAAAGTVDYVSGENGLQPAEAFELAAAYPDRFDFVSKPGLYYGHIDLNLANPLLADRRVRQALLLGLDRPEMLRRLFPDPRLVADSFLPPLYTGAQSAARAYPTDPERAKTLLAEAGFRPGPDGILVDPAGNRFSIGLASSAAFPKNLEQAQWVKASWSRLGIEVRTEFYPPETLFGEILPHRRFDAAYYVWILGPEASPVNLLASQSSPTEANGFSGQNYTGFADPAMDAALAELVAELDGRKRRPIWNRIQDIYAEELPVLPLFFQDQAYLVPRWLTGLGPVGHGTPTSFWVENWRAG
jgi:peptide/nickel transport system substrate-binding protein